jgi:hypothetical protein
MQKLNDLSRCLTPLEPDSTRIALGEQRQLYQAMATHGLVHIDGPGTTIAAGLAVVRQAKPRRSALCGPHWLARREREEAPRERAGAIRECSGSAGHDPIGVAIPPVPEGQRLGAVVPSPYRERPRHSQDHDRRLGAQASDRPVAARAGGRGAGRRHSASRAMTGGRRKHPTVLAQPVRL